MNRHLDRYLDLLWRMFEYDIEVFSQPWLYYWLLIPAIGYFVFYIVKWIVLTTPLWLPFTMILQSLRGKKKAK